MKRLIILQLVFAIIAVASGLGSIGFGQNQVIGRTMSYFVRDGLATKEVRLPLEIDTGFDGGAIALGVISAACFLGVVWMEIVKFKSSK